MKLAKRILLFLILNFGALAYGSWLMNNGPLTEWYMSLNQAPWTPPGWVFGVAWTLIMICFSIYLGYLFLKSNTLQLQLAVAFQLVLNISWNYVFFNQHKIALALVIISTLTVVVFTFFFSNRKRMHTKSYLLLPYMVWMLIATSLNAYILLNN